ncbi:MAG TPA: signal peptidase I [Dehalococcoidia bacterium]
MSLFSTAPPDPEDRTERTDEAAPVITSPDFTPADPLETADAVEPLETADAADPSEQTTAPPARRRARRVGGELVQTLLLAALIFFAVRSMAQNFRVEGSSMEPGLHDGQYLLVDKAVYFKLNLKTLSKYIPFIHAGNHPDHFLFHSPHRGDVIVFRFPQDPSRDFIKRVIAVPGDTVEVISGTVYVNGTPLDEPYISARPDYDYPKQVVPDGGYFVLGDNRNNSFDSHIWNFVPEDNIIGQAMISYWPLSDFGGAGNRSIDVGFIHIPLP